jgi:hypothetical protein
MGGGLYHFSQLNAHCSPRFYLGFHNSSFGKLGYIFATFLHNEIIEMVLAHDTELPSTQAFVVVSL